MSPCRARRIRDIRRTLQQAVTSNVNRPANHRRVWRDASPCCSARILPRRRVREDRFGLERQRRHPRHRPSMARATAKECAVAPRLRRLPQEQFDAPLCLQSCHLPAHMTRRDNCAKPYCCEIGCDQTGAEKQKAPPRSLDGAYA
jgi:hypothetical protein